METFNAQNYREQEMPPPYSGFFHSMSQLPIELPTAPIIVSKTPLTLSHDHLPLGEQPHVEIAVSSTKSLLQASNSQSPNSGGYGHQPEALHHAQLGGPISSLGIFCIHDDRCNLLGASKSTILPSDVPGTGMPHPSRSPGSTWTDQHAPLQTVPQQLRNLFDIPNASGSFHSNGYQGLSELGMMQTSFAGHIDTIGCFRGLSGIDTNISTNTTHLAMSPEVLSSTSTASSKTLVNSPSHVDPENSTWTSDFKGKDLYFGGAEQDLRWRDNAPCLDHLSSESGPPTAVGSQECLRLEKGANVTDTSNSEGINEQ